MSENVPFICLPIWDIINAKFYADFKFVKIVFKKCSGKITLKNYANFEFFEFCIFPMFFLIAYIGNIF
jgi:hypothetical protein